MQVGSGTREVCLIVDDAKVVGESCDGVPICPQGWPAGAGTVKPDQAKRTSQSTRATPPLPSGSRSPSQRWPLESAQPFRGARSFTFTKPAPRSDAPLSPACVYVMTRR